MHNSSYSLDSNANLNNSNQNPLSYSSNTKPLTFAYYKSHPSKLISNPSSSSSPSAVRLPLQVSKFSQSLIPEKVRLSQIQIFIGSKTTAKMEDPICEKKGKLQWRSDRDSQHSRLKRFNNSLITSSRDLVNLFTKQKQVDRDSCRIYGAKPNPKEWYTQTQPLNSEEIQVGLLDYL